MRAFGKESSNLIANFPFALAPGSMDEAEQTQRLLVRLLAPPSVAPLQPIPEQSPVGRLEPIPVRPRLAAHLLAKAFARWLIYRAGLRAIQRLTGVWLFLGHPRIRPVLVPGLHGHPKHEPHQ